MLCGLSGGALQERHHMKYSSVHGLECEITQRHNALSLATS